MKAKDISEALWYNFHQRDYKLDNSFVFNWECDFFSMTKSGFAHEIEIKVSRSDFRADFKKQKHNYFKQIYKGQELCLHRGHLIYDVKIPITKPKIDEKGRRMRDENYKIILEETGFFRDTMLSTVEYKIPERHQELETKLISSSIRIFKPIVPNKFYYAVPEGLITKDEVPKYAGLLYICENNIIREVKRSPFIHRNKLDLTKILLNKFHHLSLKQRSDIKWLQYEKSKIHKNPQNNIQSNTNTFSSHSNSDNADNRNSNF